jgi:hypothetical protein
MCGIIDQVLSEYSIIKVIILNYRSVFSSPKKTILFSICEKVMDLNATRNITFQHFGLIEQLIIIAPDYINLVLLITFIYGMYYGIEIQHPLFAVLFLDLVVVLLFDLVNILLFFIKPIGLFMQLSLASTGIALNFHFTSWCLTSILRYIYIVHGDWFDTVIPNPRCQCLAAFTLSILFSISLTLPLFGYITYLGKII